jgi:hypothetical protein
VHVLEGAQRGERDNHEGDDESRPSRSSDERPHEPSKGPRGIEQGKRPSHDQDREDDRGAVHDAARHDEQGGHRADGRLRDARVAARDHELTAGGGVSAALVLAGGDDPGHRDRDKNGGQQQYERMGQLERHEPGGAYQSRRTCHL